MKRVLAAIGLVLALLLAAVGPTPAAAQSASDVMIVYGPSSYQTAYARYPSGTDKRSAVIFIHGGCWESGDRQMWEAKANELRNDGYITWNMEYRLGSAQPWADIPWDVAEVVHRLSSDPRVKNISLIGASAGGHLALNYAVKNPTAINTVATISPITDPHQWQATSPNSADCFERFAGGTQAQQPGRWLSLSPIVQVRDAGKRPPIRTYLYGSAADWHTPRDQVDRFYAEVIKHQPIYGAVISPHCQTATLDHGKHLIPCAWPAIKNFLPAP